jgi:excisionase family DNA binding protein
VSKPSAPEPKKALDLPAAASYLSIHVYALRRAIWAKELPAAKIGHKLIVAISDLDKWFELKKAATL